MTLAIKQAAPCIKKILRSCIREGYSFVYEHPILFSFGVLLYLLYRSSPGLFAFLLSTSPVIICTTILLGILLSYGEIDLPAAAGDHKGNPEISASKVENSPSDIRFEANHRVSLPEFGENTSNIKGKESKQTVIIRERTSKHVRLEDDVPLLTMVDSEDEKSYSRCIPRTLTPFPSMVNLNQGVGLKEDLNCNKKREVDYSSLIPSTAAGQTSLFDGALLRGMNEKDTSFGLVPSSENVNDDMQESLIKERIFTDSETKKDQDVSEEKDTKGAGTSKPVCPVSIHQLGENNELNIDTSNIGDDNLLDSSLGSPWARVSPQDGSSGFDSDGAESSSPDASMTDIAPVLDEIDPLLGSTHPDSIPKDGSDTDSHVSEDHETDDESNDEANDNDAKDNVEGENKDDGREAAFLWTADDEKNLMDLGYSEMERNRRLELLMARRRSRKNIRFETDNDFMDIGSNGAGKNLDDLSHFRAQVQPISVPRRNPFDLPYDSEEAAMPGSAPSILHRKNPFDFPLDQSDDSGIPANLSSNTGDSVTSSHRDMFFRRHESFNFGRVDAALERRFSKLKPYFVPETVEWSASNLQRQFSDKSESKLSSVTESDVASSAADQDDYRGHGEKDLQTGNGSPAFPQQDSDLIDGGSDCSDGINSVDVELDNSDIDDREIALQHFVFERSQEREAHISSEKGKGREEDYVVKPTGNSMMPFHPVPDLLGWEDGDGDSHLGAKPSFGPNTEIACSQWVSSLRSAEQGGSGSGDLPEYLCTEVASSSTTVVLGSSNLAQRDGNFDVISSSNNEMPLDNLIHGSMEPSSEFVEETLPVICRDLHPIPEEKVVENFNMQEKDESAIFTDSAASLTGLHVIEEHFDAGLEGSLSSAFVSSCPEANDVILSPSNEHTEALNPCVSMAAGLNRDSGDIKEETAAAYLLDSDDEVDKIYPEPMEDSGIDESFLSELDAVGDFRVEAMRPHQQLPEDSPANDGGADSMISPWNTDNVSLTMSEASAVDSREQSPLVDELNEPEFSWSGGASHGDPEQTVYNPRKRILEAINLEVNPPHDTPSAATLAVGSNEPVVAENESMRITTSPEIAMLDVKSLEDIKTAFKLVRDGMVAEASMDTETPHIAGQLHVIDAKSVDDIHAALRQHYDSVVNSSLEGTRDKDGYEETAESLKHDITGGTCVDSPQNVKDGREAAEPKDNTSNTDSGVAKAHNDFDAVFNERTDGSAKSAVHSVEAEDARETKEGSEQQ